VAVRGQADKLKSLFDQSPVPMAILDGRRRYVDVNGPLRLLIRLSQSEVRGYRLGDLSPPGERPTVDAIWARLLDSGFVTGRRQYGPDGDRVDTVYYALANVLPGLHLFAVVPAGWSEDELGGTGDQGADADHSSLSAREIEVLQLAADGLSVSSIAAAMFISPFTVKTHLSNIYEKLEVSCRAAAVATGMRLGLIL
jgi:two-component system nitrate/nitrite response regulator NarL